MIQAKRKPPKGVTLTELMIAVVVLSVGALGLLGSFGGIARSVQSAKAKTLATNLCQEKTQILKQKNYYRVLVTTAPAYNTDFGDPIPFDPSTGYFPPETIIEGGITFTRLTFVEVAQEVSPNIVTLAPTSSDTGLKLITVTTLWGTGDHARKIAVQSLLSNPDATVQNSTLTGFVQRAGPIAIPNATVSVSENSGWVDTTDGAGLYRINLFPGSYNILVEAAGYFPQLVAVTIPANATVNQNVTLSPMTTQAVQGYAWIRDHLVISQVVASSESAAAPGFYQEYVEVFNPTTGTVQMKGRFGLKFQRRVAQDAMPRVIDIDYDYKTPVSTNIAPGGYYLFANTSPVTVGGVSLQADAIWAVGAGSNTVFPYFHTAGPYGEDNNIIPINTDGGGEGAGGVQLYDIVTGNAHDTFGWKGFGGQFPGLYETIPLDQMTGFQAGEQFTREVSTAGYDHATLGMIADLYGRAYDHGWNLDNLLTNSEVGTILPPHNSASAVRMTVTGTPAIGAVVTCNDGLSGPVTVPDSGWFWNGTDNRFYKNPGFSLPSIATGTWSVYFSSTTAFADSFVEVSSVVIVGGAPLEIPHATTVPAWEVPGRYSVFVTSSSEEGFVLGTLRNVFGGGISPAITVTNNLASVLANTASPYRFFLRTVPGTYNVTANPGNANASYVSAVQTGVAVNAGQVTSGVDFVLSQAGSLRGFVSRDGTNALPGIAMTATNAAGLVETTVVTGNDGRFTMTNISTGAYVIEAALGSGEASVPLSVSTTVTVGTSLFVGSFTVVGAAGYVTGNVTQSGSPIKTGVMVVVSTAVVAAPPALSSASMTGIPYYIGASYEDGSYSLEVKGSTSTTFRVYAFYPVQNATGTWSTLTASSASVQILPGQTKTGVSFAW
ncbi:MAG: carboxypeptidase regulatory-like domain-containing protein [Elusimicrobia bacterium]|nr:carboxypeptidase regulatory-like domain-containing protein [Elusimicrobiota bacterium]